MSKVALIGCPNYELNQVKTALMRGFSYFGGVKNIFQNKKRILLKPNLLTGEKIEKAVTTHPSLLQGITEILLENDFFCGYGDSPGFGSLETVAKKAGIYTPLKNLKIEVVDFVGKKEVSFAKALQNRQFTIAKGLFNYDALLSLPKWKTHGLTRITGAVKNQYGCIPGLLKGEFHFKLPDVIHFSRMLVDLNLLLKPDFYVMDAIIAMEGNGPRNGRPLSMGLLAFSRDPIALDATLSRLIRLDPRKVITCLEGEKGGLGYWQDNAIELVGDDFSHFYKADFDVQREPTVSYKKEGFLRSFRNLLLSKPIIDYSKCKACGICIDICPAQPKALLWKEKQPIPQHNYKYCIRCYCCQELCPHNAIQIKASSVGKILRR
jgi:uncharacterized protein (DUF362 family)/Pyruvate/2-oxoacid:ferredoxin oxidoreductase delta subunit